MRNAPKKRWPIAATALRHPRSFLAGATLVFVSARLAIGAVFGEDVSVAHFCAGWLSGAWAALLAHWIFTR